MQFSDAPPAPPPDVDRFVTYMTPEMQEDKDDGTDLPLPDLSTLILPEPEPQRRRGGESKPLRDTITETPLETTDDEQTFGEGLDDSAETTPNIKPRADTPSSEQQQPDSAEGAPRKRRNRRRRRRRNRAEQSVDGAATDDSSREVAPAVDSTPPAEGKQDLQRQATTADSTEPGSTPEGKTKPRRRRRRRRGPRKTSASDAPSSDGGPGPSDRPQQ